MVTFEDSTEAWALGCPHSFPWRELGTIDSSVAPAPPPPALTSLGNEGALSPPPWDVTRTRLTILEYLFSASAIRSTLFARVLLRDLARVRVRVRGLGLG